MDHSLEGNMGVKVLVTGATGFIGYHVAKTLREKSLDVRVLARADSKISDLKSLGVEIKTGDTRDDQSVRAALKACSQLYHVAAD